MSEELLKNNIAPEQNQEEDTDTLSKIASFPIWKLLYRNLWLILIVTILVGGIAAVYGFLTSKPKYTATCSVLLSISLDSTVDETNSATDISLSKLYLPTVTEIIASPKVEKGANEIYKGQGRINLNSVGVSHNENSLIFSMRYTDLSPELAKSKLKTFVEAGDRVLKEKGPDYVPAKEFILTQTQREFNVTSFHDGVKFVVTGAIIGLVGSVAFVFLRYVLDNKFKSSKELEEITGVSVIAYIEKTN